VLSHSTDEQKWRILRTLVTTFLSKQTKQQSKFKTTTTKTLSDVVLICNIIAPAIAKISKPPTCSASVCRTPFRTFTDPLRVLHDANDCFNYLRFMRHHQQI